MVRGQIVRQKLPMTRCLLVSLFAIVALGAQERGDRPGLGAVGSTETETAPKMIVTHEGVSGSN